MRKLRFKNRGGILYFGYGDKLKSSRFKYNNVNKNIIKSKVERGELNEALGIGNNIEKTPLINDLLKKVMSEKNMHLKHKTMRAYNSISDTNIIPYFDGKIVTEIKPIDFKIYQDSLIEKQLGSSSINTCRVLLNEVFELAIIGGYIQFNPVSMIKKPKVKAKQKKVKTFSLEEIDELLSNVSGEMRNFFGILFFTGMRSGEVLALTWDDIDFSTDTISIIKTIAEGIINSPKTVSSFRDIEMLDKAKEFFQAQRLESGMANGYVFLNAKKSYYYSNARFYNAFIDLQKKLSYKDIRTLHDTRHTFASLMLNNGIDPLWVSHTLGHENLKITLDTYTHFMPKKKKMSIKFLDEHYKVV